MAGDEQTSLDTASEAPPDTFPVGTSVAALGTVILLLNVAAVCLVGGRLAFHHFALSLATLYFGAKARGGQRRALRWCLGLSILFLVMVVLGLALWGFAASVRALCLLAAWFAVAAWSIVNIAWLVKTLAATRGPRPEGPATLAIKRQPVRGVGRTVAMRRVVR